MSYIGGNITGTLQVKTPRKDENGQPVRNAIGEQIIDWPDAVTLTGFLDLMGGGTGYTAYNAKILESTHVFLCDYEDLPQGVTAENARMVIAGQAYDVTLIDDPMGLHEHLEIFMKYTGGQ